MTCKLRKDGGPCQRKGRRGKPTFANHKRCRKNYEQCEQMKELQKNYNEFKEIVKKTGRLEIPPTCIPFLGTKQRKFRHFESVEIKCQEKREAVAQDTKKRIGWQRPSCSSKNRADNLIQPESYTIVLDTSMESSAERQLAKNRKNDHEDKEGETSLFLDEPQYSDTELDTDTDHSNNDVQNDAHLNGEDSASESSRTSSDPLQIDSIVEQISREEESERESEMPLDIQMQTESALSRQTIAKLPSNGEDRPQAQIVPNIKDPLITSMESLLNFHQEVSNSNQLILIRGRVGSVRRLG